MDREGLKMAKKKEKGKPMKIEMKSKRFKGKAVVAKVNGEPVAEIDKVTIAERKNKRTVFLSGDPKDDKPEKSIRLHRTESEAIGRFHRRFPRITPKFRKLL